jgi:hypothetical protein
VKATTFNQYKSAMIERLRERFNRQHYHDETNLAKISVLMIDLCRAYYRGDRTPTIFFDRLLYYAFCFWYRRRLSVGLNKNDTHAGLMDEFISDIEAKCITKGNEYTTDLEKDRLENFKLVSRLNARLCWIDIWFVYVAKHITACDFFTVKGVETTEPITERAEDIGLYAILGQALCDEWNATQCGLTGAKSVTV